MTDMDKRIIGQYLDIYLPVLDGVVVTVRNYAYWLNQKNCDCYIAAADAPKGHAETDEFPVLRYKAMALKKRPPYRVGIPILDSQFEKEQRKLCPVLVHAHSPFLSGMEALRLAKQKQIPLVASFHSKYYDDALELTKSEMLAEQAVKYIVSFYNKADYVWTVNQGTAQTLRDYGFKKDIEIWPNGTDFTFPQDLSAARKSVEEKYGIDAGEHVFLFVGQQIVQKNIAAILDACAKYRLRGGRFKLLMVGEGNAKAQMMEKAHRLGLMDCVRFTGAIQDREELCNVYLRADLFVFPSVYDNAPLVVREAAMAGCPAVLVAGSNAAENMQDGVNAYLCQNSTESIADAIERAMADDGKRREVGQRARKMLAKTWEQVVDRVYDRYEEILREYEKKN